jgi:SAM-dependent methyltransferase
MYSYFIIILILIILFYLYFKKNLRKRTKIEDVYLGDSFITVRNFSKGEEYNLTYGEITEDGIKTIIDYLKKNNIPVSTYIDLGSGNGRSLAYAIKNGFNKAKGVEIVEERHKYAISAMDKLPEYKDSIELIQDDIFNLKPNFFPNETTIFVSNLLFPPETNQKLFQYLSDNTLDDITLMVSKMPKDLHKFKLNKTISIPMSWEKESTCYILRKR